MMFHCGFIMMRNKRYQCIHIWGSSEFKNDFTFTSIKVIYLNVGIKPPLGFCKRPHKYLAKEVK